MGKWAHGPPPALFERHIVAPFLGASAPPPPLFERPTVAPFPSLGQDVLSPAAPSVSGITCSSKEKRLNDKAKREPGNRILMRQVYDTDNQKVEEKN